MSKSPIKLEKPLLKLIWDLILGKNQVKNRGDDSESRWFLWDTQYDLFKSNIENY